MRCPAPANSTQRWPGALSCGPRALARPWLIGVWLAAMAPHAAAVAAEQEPLVPALNSTSTHKSVGISTGLPLKREAETATGGGRAVAGLSLSVAILVLAGAAVLRWKAGVRPPASSGAARGLGAWLHRAGAGVAAERLRVLQSARLTAHASVHVVQWDGRDWLLGCTEQGMTVIEQRGSPPSAGPGASATAGVGAGRSQPAGADGSNVERTPVDGRTES